MYYHDLLGKYDSHKNIPYYELLSTIEWKNKRNEILQRDHYQCLDCYTREYYQEYSDTTKKYYYMRFE